jgi:hypothetical protein
MRELIAEKMLVGRKIYGLWKIVFGRCKPSFAAIKTPRGCPSRAASSAAHVLTGMLTERLTVVVPVAFRPALARLPPWVGGFGFISVAFVW